jgi:predicted permease
MRHAWGALADAWYLRTEGWTMDAVMRDVRMAIRSLLRRPSFTVIGGLTVAVGIAATTAIYSIVDGVLVDQLPVPEPERLVSYNHDAPGLGVNVPIVPHSEAMYVNYVDRARTVDLALFGQGEASLVTGDEPLEVHEAGVTASYFRVMGVEPILGRGFVEGEDEPGAEPVVVIGHGLWEQSFGGRRDVIGELVEIDGVQRRIVGVMPEKFSFINEQLWLPTVIDRANPDEDSYRLIAVGRLRDGQTIESANTEMDAILRDFAERAGAATEMLQQAGFRADVKPLKDIFVQDLRQPLLILLGTVAFVFLIACANVANLFLVHAEARQRESAVRTAMGASRLDVVRQYLSESILLALGGGAVGLVLASLGVRGLLNLVPTDIPKALDLGIDGSVLAFTVVVSIAGGVLFGLLPALGYGRGAVGEVLREGGRSSTAGRQRHRLRSALVVGQVALALVLLVGSGLMLRSLVALRDVDLGFEPEHVLTFHYVLPEARYEAGEPLLAFHRELVERLEALPNVASAGLIEGLPLTNYRSASPTEAVDHPVGPGELAPLVETLSVTPGYFETMSIDLLEGRPLEWTDRRDEFRGVVVSEALARSFWPGESALGKQLRGPGEPDGEENDPWQVVGVARDVRFDGANEEPLPLMYRPILDGNIDATGRGPRAMDVALRVAGGDPLAALPAAGEALRALDSRLPVINPRPMQDIVTQSLQAASFTVLLLGLSAGVALLLGTVGLYGVISFIVARRTPEIGVRMALGASTRSVLREVIGRGMVLTGVGLALGLFGAWALSRALASLLYGVSANDPVTFGGTALLLGAVSLLATWIPARRASRVDPVEALRSE